MCLSVQSLEETPQNKAKFKDSGVKKLFVIGLAQATQENYDNVVQLWFMVGINNFDATIATDLKLANILVGIMSHSGSLPCTWCYAQKSKLDSEGELRTTSNHKRN